MFIAFGMFAREFGGDAVEVGLGLRLADAGFQTYYDPRVLIVAVLDPVVSLDLTRVQNGKPYLRPENLFRSVKTGRRYADDGVRMLVDSHRRARNPRISIKPGLPARVA